MQSTFIGIISLGIIILVHELGHYCAAIYYKIQVEEFAIGIGPKIFSFMYKETQWSIRIFPLGGFCRMKNPNLEAYKDDPSATIPQPPRTFNALFFRGKLIILLAGAGFNFIFFILLSFLLFFIGNTQYELKTYVDPIHTPATQILEQGDYITHINETPILSYSHLVDTLSHYKGQEIIIHFERNTIPMSNTITLNTNPPALGVTPFIAPVITNTDNSSHLGFIAQDIITEVNKHVITNALEIPPILQNYDTNIPVSFTILRNNRYRTLDVSLSPSNTKDILTLLGIEYQLIAVNPWPTMKQFIQKRSHTAFTIISGTALFFVKLLQIQSSEILENTAGPIRLISIVGTSTLHNAQKYGWIVALIQLINITSILSLSIGSLNLLPIPVLDGGQVLFYALHRIRNRTPKVRTLTRYNTVGVIIILLLFVFILFSDIMSFF